MNNKSCNYKCAGCTGCCGKLNEIASHFTPTVDNIPDSVIIKRLKDFRARYAKTLSPNKLDSEFAEFIDSICSTLKNLNHETI